MLRQQLVGSHLEHGNDNLQNGRQVEALADFRLALQFGSRERIRAAATARRGRAAAGSCYWSPELIASVDALAAKPKEERHDFHYRGDSRGLNTAIASSYGLTVIFDDAFPNRRVRFDVEDVGIRDWPCKQPDR